MKKRLKSIKIDEISLVPRGANQGAKQVLFKSHNFQNNDIIDFIESEKSLNKGVTPMDPKEILAALEKAKKENDEMKADNEKQKAEIDGLKKSIEDLQGSIAKANEPAAKPEDITKGMTEDVKKAFEAQNEEIKKLRTQNELDSKVQKELIAKQEKVEYIAKAEKEYPNVPGEPEAKGSFLKSVEALPESEKTFALQLLKSANETVGATMTEVGKASQTPAGGSAEAQLETMAKAYQSDNKGLSFEQAYTEVVKTEAGKKLYNDYVTKK